MHHAFLDMQIRQYILALHRPFMLQAQKDPRFHFSRRVCQESAMIIATYAERLRLPSDSLDDLSKLMVMSIGSFRGPLSLDIISVLGLEVVSQLEETGSGPSSASIGLNHTLALDPLAELARAQRAPIIRLLEHIKDQLLQIIKLGHPTLKRYIFLAGILSQIYAMERGQPILSAVLNTAKDSVKECYDVLQSYRAANTPREVEVIDHGLLDGLDIGAMVSTNYQIYASYIALLTEVRTSTTWIFRLFWFQLFDRASSQEDCRREMKIVIDTGSFFPFRSMFDRLCPCVSEGVAYKGKE
jgi:hypothetical protein